MKVSYAKFAKLLEEKGITAYRISKDTGIKQTSLSDWKAGRAIPKADKLAVIAKYFNVPIEFFFENKEGTE